jgi:hypothetical protein
MFEDEETLNETCRIAKHKKCTMIKDHHGASDEYFREALRYPISDFGWPRALYSSTIHTRESQGFEKMYQALHKKLEKIERFLGTHENALCALYPEDGYIGWHHNGNAPGHNILFSYSQDGDGHFKYYDKEKDEVVYMYDEPGWNAKVGYYPSEYREPDRVYWHAAFTKKPRLSIAFVIKNREMWKNMVDSVTMGDYDKDFIQSQGTMEELKSDGYVK